MASSLPASNAPLGPFWGIQEPVDNATYHRIRGILRVLT